jgi:hypothetical protein
MKEQLEKTISMVSTLKNGVSHLTKELEKIQFQLEELKSIINSKPKESDSIVPTEIIEEKKKKTPVVVRREDQEIPEVIETPSSYKIQVVGLGVQKLE